jgi:uncharacterized protein YbbC (DUF1343 family)
MYKLLIFLCILLLSNQLTAQKTAAKKHNASTVIFPGAYQFEEYLPLLKGKKVGVFANPTSMVGDRHLVDTLQKLGVNVTKIYGPEHGFRGTADAGEQVGSYVDSATGVKVVSLYGRKLKPTPADLEDVDILLFDIQDVGVRFYTYISSLEYFLESAIQNNLPLVILDRPNPNGFYVDGPVLDSNFKSFVGMQPVPVVYGMTIGEYAQMLLGEEWLPWRVIKKAKKNQITMSELLGFEEKNTNFKLYVIRCKNYTHNSRYVLPVMPSPNLAEMGAVYWYPSTCFFEGTVLSEGRGTEHPFEIFGHPGLPDSLYAFSPHPTVGAKEPKLNGRLCFGWNITDQNPPTKIELHWLLQAYKLFKDKDSFFIHSKGSLPRDYYFNILAGNNNLMQQITAGKSEAEIRKSWQPKLNAFLRIRKKYLLYPDFE